MFSPLQTKILNKLGDRKLKISELAEEVYRSTKMKPLSPRTSVVSAIFYINLKCTKLKLNWRIDGNGSGRNGKTVYRKKI